MKLKECGEAKRKGKERKVRSGHDIYIFSLSYMIYVNHVLN